MRSYQLLACVSILKDKELFNKLFVILILLLSSGSSIFGQTKIDQMIITYVAYEKSIPEVLNDISYQSKISFIYSRDDFNNRSVSVNSKGLALNEFLDLILKGTGLVYEVVEKSIVIYEKEFYERKNFTLTGKVYDNESGEVLSFADIYLADFSIGVSSNEHGFYYLSLPKGEVDLYCSYLSYKDYRKEINLESDLRLDIFMSKEDEVLLDQVLITAEKLEAAEAMIDFFRPEQLQMEDLNKMVSLGGEDDILRFLYSKAGILTGADGFGGIHIRGGNSDQNQYLLDGVPIYNPDHAMGLYSIFNSNAIKSSHLYKNDIPARYGGNLSSILDIKTREGNKKSYHGNFDFGLFTLKAGLEGPIVKNKSSFMLSARRTYADLWISTIRDLLNDQEGSSGSTSYYNYDINSKLHFILNKENDLSISFYRGKDAYDYDYYLEDLAGPNNWIREEQRVNSNHWSNQLASIKWTSNISSDLFLKATGFYSDFNADTFVKDWLGEIDNTRLKNYRFTESLFVSNIKDLGLMVDLDHHVSQNSIFRYGLKSVYHKFEPLLKVLDHEQFPSLEKMNDLPNVEDLKNENQADKEGVYESRAYVELDRKPTKSRRYNIGLHFAHFAQGGRHHLSLEPRIMLTQKIVKGLHFMVNTHFMSQMVQQVDNKEIGFPSSIWLPSHSILGPQKSWQFSMGFNYKSASHFEFMGQMFYRNMKHLLMIAPGDNLDIIQGNDWENDMKRGSGYAYGIETGVAYSGPTTKINLNYTWLRSKRKFDGINANRSFDHRFSRTHNLNLSFVQNLTKNSYFSVSWTYGSGNPYTFPTQIATFIENDKTISRFVYEEMNNFRIPDYHRLDIELNFKNQFPWGEQKFSIGAYNAYNRKNPFYINYDNQSRNMNEFSTSSFNYVYVFPLMPVLTYSISF